ncbi:hypothetical protein jhhlp_004332 [Lomentospora prolificans]|uniref:Ubiquitin-like domain-containing protein n=1 Tax=Lomentospora prolificans TaxID=41688 RepID=A0A2N3NBB9_9PEZI|nr:hypothetical protein jhhlp_004332 [Lomentospora prolificans]
MSHFPIDRHTLWAGSKSHPIALLLHPTTMTELTFARAFLTALDSRPIKISSDHVEDPRSFPSNRPANILPKMPKPMSKPSSSTSSTTTSETLTITLKSLHNPRSTSPSLPLTTSILDLKHALESRAGVPTDKARILHRKKPVPDSKILKDLLAAEDSANVDALELGVMVMGGAASLKPVAAAAGATTVPMPVPGPDGSNAEARQIVESPQFWTDLQGFLIQRVKDEKTGEELATLFKKSWEGRAK